MNAPKVAVPEGVSGNWRVSKFVVPKMSIESMRLAWQGRPCPPGTYTRLLQGGSVIMSDTPAEWRDCSGFYYEASGNVLVTGLGIGMLLGTLLSKESIKSVTVIENSADVLALVADSYKEPRCSIIKADAYSWTPEKGTRFDYAWHDIWPTICGDNIADMTRLRRHYQRFMVAPKRQSCWCEYECKRQALSSW